MTWLDLCGFSLTHSCQGLQTRALTLNDIDGKGFGDLLHSIDSGGADVVCIETRVEAVDENAPVRVGGDVHSRGQSGAVLHAKPQVCG